MFFKVLTVILVILAAAYMLAGGRAALPRRRVARAPARAPEPVPDRVPDRVASADDLVKCGRCGVWLPAGQRCDCTGRPDGRA